MNNFFWSHTKISTPVGGTSKYGYLYNYYAVSDVRNIAPTGWHVPTKSEWNALITYLGVTNLSNRLRSVGFTYWNNANGTDEVGFGARGSGYRDYSTGVSSGLQTAINIHSSTAPGGFPYQFQITSNNAYQLVQFFSNEGVSLRYVKDDATLATMTGNDGRVYAAVKIGTQVWTAENSAETKYRNGDLITKVTGNSSWAALSTEAYCAYNDNESNVLL